MYLEHVASAGAVLALLALEGTHVAVHKVDVVAQDVLPREGFGTHGAREGLHLGNDDDKYYITF